LFLTLHAINPPPFLHVLKEVSKIFQ